MSLDEVKSRIQHEVLEFQLGDLKKAVNNGLNFLAAIGLMVATEFLGGLLTGKLGIESKSKERFEAGFRYMGEPYAMLLDKNKKGVNDIYKNIRCGLVHQYLPAQVKGIYTRGSSELPGILEQSGQLLIVVENYTRDLEAAVNHLVESLPQDNGLLAKCEQALSRIPKLD